MATYEDLLARIEALEEEASHRMGEFMPLTPDDYAWQLNAWMEAQDEPTVEGLTEYKQRKRAENARLPQREQDRDSIDYRDDTSGDAMREALDVLRERFEALYCGWIERGVDADADDVVEIVRPILEQYEAQIERLRHEKQCIQEECDYNNIERGTYKHSMEDAQRNYQELLAEKRKLEEAVILRRCIVGG